MQKRFKKKKNPSLHADFVESKLKAGLDVTEEELEAFRDEKGRYAKKVMRKETMDPIDYRMDKVNRREKEDERDSEAYGAHLKELRRKKKEEKQKQTLKRFREEFEGLGENTQDQNKRTKRTDCPKDKPVTVRASHRAGAHCRKKGSKI